MRIYKFVLVTLFGTCLTQADQYYKIYDVPGRYTYANENRILEVTEDESGLKYSWTIKKSSITKIIGPISAEGFGDQWFFFVESEDRVWFFDGSSDLVLLQSSYGASSVNSIHVAGNWFRTQVPEKLALRLPQDMKDQILTRKKTFTSFEELISEKEADLREAKARFFTAKSDGQTKEEIDKAERDVRIQESILASIRARRDKEIKSTEPRD